MWDCPTEMKNLGTRRNSEELQELTTKAVALHLSQVAMTQLKRDIQGQITHHGKANAIILFTQGAKIGTAQNEQGATRGLSSPHGS